MSPKPASHNSDTEAGQLLYELERRQDDVLRDLDELDAKLSEVLRGLGVSVAEDIDPAIE